MLSALLSLVLLGVSVAAPPPASQPPRPYPQQIQHLQQLNQLDYYLDNPDAANYYNQAQQKQESQNSNQNEAPSRLESLEPDSEVELIPGAQQPQQPPQQVPVSPNLPGLIPGQRVYIVNMPVPGYRPGTIGGYQPVYVVAAAPNNPNYVQQRLPGGQGVQGGVPGYQNTILLDPSGQGFISPFLGYQRGVQGASPGYLLGQNQFVNRPYDLLYQDPAAFGYQPIAAVAPGQNPIGRPEGQRGSVRLSQLVSLQAQPNEGSDAAPASNEKPNQPIERSRTAEADGSSVENATNEDVEIPRRSARPTQDAPRNKTH